MNELKTAINAAKEAGKVLMSYYGKNNLKLKYKDTNFNVASMVTNADIESEKAIVGIIEKEFPKHNIYSEEDTDKKKGSEYTWYVDPLDGTSNFSRNIPLFGISIGLTKKDQPILGVLYFPALKLLVHAETGKGAYANGKLIHVSNRSLSNSLYYSGGIFLKTPQIIVPLAKKVSLTKIIDASSYELAQIAMGDAEIYALTSVPHDVAAGSIIIRESGGKITDYEGKKWNIKSKTIVATNGTVHDDALQYIKKYYK